MSTPTEDAFRAELDDALAVIEPRLEGLRDFERLNILDEARAVVLQALTFYERRRQVIQDTLDAMDALARDGYPEMATEAIMAPVYDSLAEQIRTEVAALEHFTEIVPATQLRPTLGDPEPKGAI